MQNTATETISHLIPSDICVTFQDRSSDNKLYKTEDIAEYFSRELGKTLKKMTDLHRKASIKSRKPKERILGRQFKELLMLADQLSKESDIFQVRLQVEKMSMNLAKKRKKILIKSLIEKAKENKPL